MKNSPGVRLWGKIYILLGALGILFCIAVIAAIWLVKPNLQSSASSALDSFDDVLQTTQDGILVLDSTLDNTNSNLQVLILLIENLDGTFGSITESLESSGALIGDDIRLTIIESQNALSSASASAEIIHKTLSFLASIPLIGVDYEPEVPLHLSLDQMAGSMDDIPESLESIEQSLVITADGVTLLNDDLLVLSQDIEKFESDIEDAQVVLEEYDNIIIGMERTSGKLQNNLSKYLIVANLFLTGIFFWLGVAQSNVLLQGIAYVNDEVEVVNLADVRRE